VASAVSTNWPGWLAATDSHGWSLVPLTDGVPESAVTATVLVAVVPSVTCRVTDGGLAERRPACGVAATSAEGGEALPASSTATTT